MLGYIDKFFDGFVAIAGQDLGGIKALVSTNKRSAVGGGVKRFVNRTRDATQKSEDQQSATRSGGFFLFGSKNGGIASSVI
ncbi:MAG: hypothetical protein AAGJ34_05445 [Pseudomonadota bacterium]